VSLSGPLPDTPKTYVDATLGHLASAVDFGRLLAEKVEALEAERDRLRAALHQIWLLADAEEPSSVRAGGVAQEVLAEGAFEVLERGDPHPFPEDAA
jgi:hypothetical protein